MKGGNAVQSFIAATKCQQLKLNTIIEVVSPPTKTVLGQVLNKLKLDPTIGPHLHHWEALYPTFAFLCNKTSSAHKDSTSPLGGYDVLLAAGDFTGGNFYLKDLGIEVPYLPGDIIFVRGRVLNHGTRQWFGVGRSSLVYFVQEGVIRWVGEPDIEGFASIHISSEEIVGAQEMSNRG